MLSLAPFCLPESEGNRVTLLRLASWFRHRGGPSYLSCGQPPLAAFMYQHACEKHLDGGVIRADPLRGALADDDVRSDGVGNKWRVLELFTGGEIGHKPDEHSFN